MYKEKGRGKGGEIQEKRIKTRRKKEKEIYILYKKACKTQLKNNLVILCFIKLRFEQQIHRYGLKYMKVDNTHMHCQKSIAGVGCI